MKTNKMIMAAMAAGAVLMLPAVTRATGISGTVHDFTTTTNQLYWINGAPWNAASAGRSANVCGSCHTIHHAPDPARGPLWIHTPTANTFKYYSATISESFPSDVQINSLGSSSLTCLGCHDGSIAINSQDSLSAGVITTKVKGTTKLFIATNDIVVEVSGNQDDLTHMHPIGVSYSACQGSPNLPVGSLNAVSTPFVGANGVTVANMLKGGNVECASCHDIHATIGAATSGTGIMTVASGQNLCLGCHNK
jgi:predicted CXXCH cytochrome family protein